MMEQAEIQDPLASLKSSPYFREHVSPRHFRLMWQYYPKDPYFWEVANRVHSATGKDMFLYSEGLENIYKVQIEVIIDGEVVSAYTPEFIADHQEAWGEESAEGLAKMIADAWMAKI